jgi:hypothetical protein
MLGECCLATARFAIQNDDAAECVARDGLLRHTADSAGDDGLRSEAPFAQTMRCTMAASALSCSLAFIYTAFLDSEPPTECASTSHHSPQEHAALIPELGVARRWQIHCRSGGELHAYRDLQVRTFLQQPVEGGARPRRLHLMPFAARRRTRSKTSSASITDEPDKPRSQCTALSLSRDLAFDGPAGGDCMSVVATPFRRSERRE